MAVNGKLSEESGTGRLQRHSRIVFDRLDRCVARLTKDPKPENVHRFRTNSRRVEALLAEFVPDCGNKKKLVKQLAKFRKKAGKVRDLDVQIAFLKELKLPDRQNHRMQLAEALSEEQARRSRKLVKSFDAQKVRSIRKRLRRARAEMKLDGVDCLKLALQRLPKPLNAPLNEKMLHSWRIAAKQARYMAELVGDTPEGKLIVEHLKRAQDEIGQWHDVLKLHERAVERFGDVHDSPLVSILQNISRARFKRASAVLTSTLASLTASQQEQKPPAKSPAAPQEKPSAQGAAA